MSSSSAAAKAGVIWKKQSLLRVVGLASGVYLCASLVALSVRTWAPAFIFDHGWIDILALQGSMLICSLLLARRHQMDRRELGFNLPVDPLHWLLPAFFAAALSFITGAAWILLGFHQRLPAGELTSLERLFWWCIFTPIAEEIFLRGWFQAALTRLPQGAGTAVWISALFFAFLHLFEVARGTPIQTALFRFGYASVLGFLTARTRHKEKSVLPSIGIHIIWNLVPQLIW